MFLKKPVLLLLPALLLTSCNLGWEEVTVKNGGYAIEFPGATQDTTQFSGTLLEHKTYYQNLKDKQNSYYSVTYIDIPAALDSSSLIDPCAWASASFSYDMMYFAQAVGGYLRKDSVMTMVAGHPAREFKVDFRDKTGMVTVRKFCAASRIYTLMVITRAGAEENEWINKFFDSFRLL